MYIEFRHLRTIKAIHEQGGLARAADVLNITQSALSHQVKGLEEQVGMDLFLRRSKPLKLSKAGHKLLILADQILPKVAELEKDFAGLHDGTNGRMHIAIECHACFEWLFPVLEDFRKNWGKIDVDIRPGLSFDALPALQREEVDVVISSDPEDWDGIEFIHLFDYEPTFVCASNHPLADKEFITAEDFRDQTLITYPVDKTRLDVFSQLLMPARIEPAAIRQAELTAVIVLLVASGRGVSVLPDWVVADQKYGHDFVTKRLTETGITRGLYAAVRKNETDAAFMKDFVGFTKARTA
ncbi:LysR family transcriptional regulator [Amylibacter ulvae]|uniref:HTH-type transcriptional regulator MetR n=1 Tax=Paramylibacter ulvae TaxID=1651968 RepID=A0ABQ3D868_9RHOB|nr:LysR family transcriptional regulator [Amylibacter ulvae]GHA60489.1 LysR family transcriptional regulator [Amylibacter ulvae]